MFRYSIRSKIFLSLLLASLFPTLIIGFVTLHTITNSIESETKKALENIKKETKEILRYLENENYKHTSFSATLLSAKTQNAEFDVQKVIDNSAELLELDLIEVFDAEARLLAKSHKLHDDLVPYLTCSEEPIVKLSLNMEPKTSYVIQNGKLLTKSSFPLIDPSTLYVRGVVVVTKFLDAKFLQRLKGVIGCDLSLEAGNSFVASTLFDEFGSEIVVGSEMAKNGLYNRTNGGKCLIERMSITDYSQKEIAVLKICFDISSHLETKSSFMRTLFGGIAISLLLVLVFGHYISTSISKPIQRLVKAVNYFGKKEMADFLKKEDDDEFEYLNKTILDANSELVESIERLNEFNATLKDRVNKQTIDLTEQNKVLQGLLDDLTKAKNLMVEQEKLASLGSLVAGVSHEVKTPIGIAVTAASTIDMRLKKLENQLALGIYDKRDIESFIKMTKEGSYLIVSNLKKASELINSFKQVAVDQSSGQKRKISLSEYVEDMINSLRPKLKPSGHSVHLEIPQNIIFETYPGAIYQIITNLVINSLTHAFKGKEQGNIILAARLEGNLLEMTYEDDGVGIPKENLKRIYEPFFTTSRASGGSGLGLNIVYNLVVGKLGGSIDCQSEVGKGVKFIIKFKVND